MSVFNNGALLEGRADMDGSSLSFIVIPIVVTISLAAWLILVAFAASHPQWKADKPDQS